MQSKSLKILFGFLISSLLCHSSFSQVNLVVNPSFEIYSLCPSNTSGQVDRAVGWDTCRQSADYFNICGTSSTIQVPRNFFGYQVPYGGNAYCGFYTYNSGGFYREVIRGQLSSSLIVNQKYFVSFKINRGDSDYVTGYSSNKIGAKFSVTPMNNVSINNSATVFTNNIITDSVNWTNLFGSFTADSSYQYIMIGNFFDDSNTSVIHNGLGGDAYYYVDDVCVSTDSLFTFNYSSGIRTLYLLSSLKIFPNPANDYMVVEGASGNLKIYNELGQEVFSNESKSDSRMIDCSAWNDGIFIARVHNQQVKIIINHQK